MAKKQEEAPPSGAPEWMVTFGDMMSLLLCFFVILMAMSEIKRERIKVVVQSIQEAFGHDPSSFPAPSDEQQLPSAVFEKIQMNVPINPGGAVDMSTPGKVFLTTSVKEGLKIVIGGKLSFEEGSAELNPQARETLKDLAERMKGYGNWIDIRGHCSRTVDDVLPGLSGQPGKALLSFKRAEAVAAALVEFGVKPRRIRTTAVADRDPLWAEVSEATGRENRRIEVILTEEVIKDQG